MVFKLMVGRRSSHGSNEDVLMFPASAVMAACRAVDKYNRFFGRPRKQHVQKIYAFATSDSLNQG